MFLNDILFFNNKIKDLDKLSFDEINFLSLEANDILKKHHEKIESELFEKSVLSKIEYLNYSVQDELNSIELFHINEKFIILTFKDKTIKKIKKVKLSVLLEKLFFITKKDDLFKILFFMFLKNENFLSIQLYNYNNF